MIAIFVMPHSCRLHKCIFIFSMGSLLWAVPLWRNSLVFHDVDKVRASTDRVKQLAGEETPVGQSVSQSLRTEKREAFSFSPGLPKGSAKATLLKDKDLCIQGASCVCAYGCLCVGVCACSAGSIFAFSCHTRFPPWPRPRPRPFHHLAHLSRRISTRSGFGW